MEYYGSDKAREDFLNNKEAPAELLGKNAGGNPQNSGFTNNVRNASVVDYLFEGQKNKKKVNSAGGKLKIGQSTKVITEVPQMTA